MNQLIDIAEAACLIRGGASLAVAGTEAALDQLPCGNWIGGTIPYFMTEAGGLTASDNEVFVSDLSAIGDVNIAAYSAQDLHQLVANAPENGFSLLILPAGSASHQRFAADCASYPDAFIKPTVGWVAGSHVEDIGKVSPKVFSGVALTKSAADAVVAYVTVPADKLVSLEIVNLFEPSQGDVLTFQKTGFHVGECRVNGEAVDLAHYLRINGLDDGRLPLVGDFAGAQLNVSIQGLPASGGVDLYAPVFTDVEYRIAKPVGDYAQAFRERLATIDTTDVAWGCNCVLNYLYGSLEGKRIGGLPGAVTFGEIAYQLLNQTMVMVRVS